jgi:hypothetical protein
VLKTEIFVTRPQCVKKELLLNQCTGQSPTESDDIRCCIDTIRLPEDEQRTVRNMKRIFLKNVFFKGIYCTENSARYTGLQNCSFNQFAIVVIRRRE